MAKVNYEFLTARADGTVPIRIIVWHHNKRVRYTSDIVLYRDEYTLTKDGKIKVKSKKKSMMIEERIHQLDMKAYEWVRRNQGKDITAQDVADHLQGKMDEEGDIDFFAFADEYLAKSSIKGKKNYYTMLNSLERHLGRRKLAFREINYNMLSGFLDYLSDRPRAQSLYLGAIRHLHKEARLRYNTDELTLISPTIFERFKVPKQKQKGQRALDTEVLLRLIDYKGQPGSRAELARDCFVLSFLLMGMNSADMYDNDAVLQEGVLKYHRKKTRTRRQDEAYIEVVVPDCAKPLMRKYKGVGRVFSFASRYADEVGFNRAVNMGLKDVGEAVGEPHLQFYQARHAWASIARNECGIDAYTVDKALNHLNKELRLLDVYVKRDFTAINQANQKVIDYITDRMREQ